MKSRPPKPQIALSIILSLLILESQTVNFKTKKFHSLKRQNAKIRRAIRKMKKEKKLLALGKLKKFHNRLHKKKKKKHSRAQNVLRNETNPFYYGAVNPQFAELNRSIGALPIQGRRKISFDGRKSRFWFSYIYFVYIIFRRIFTVSFF